MAAITSTRERRLLLPSDLAEAVRVGRKTQHRVPINPQPTQPYEDAQWCWVWKNDEHFFAHTFPMWAAEECPYGRPGDRLWIPEPHWRDWREHGVVIYESTPEWGKYQNTGELVRSTYSDETLVSREDARRNMLPKFWSKRASVHMPRWACRIVVELVGVRVERLREISEDDAAAEGFEFFVGPNNRIGCYWDGPGYWDGFSRHSVHGGKTVHAAYGKDPRCRCNVGMAENLTPARCAFHHLWDKRYAPLRSWETNPWVWVLEFKCVDP